MSLQTEPSVGAPKTASFQRPALILAVLALATFLAQLDVWISNVGLPSIGRGVHSGSLSDLSWVLSGYAIIYSALLVPAGRLVDRYGRKSGFILGLAIFAAASLGDGLSGNIWVLVGFRAIQALGAAILTPASLGLVLATAPPGLAERNVKIWLTAGALSATCGPILGGILVKASWRWLFLINIPVVIIAVGLALILVPNVRHVEDERIPDLLGGLLIIMAIGGLALGVVKGSDWGWSNGRVIAAFAVAVIATISFVVRSSRHPVPVIDLNLFRSRIFGSANLAAVLGFANFAMLLLGGILWLQGHWHYSAIRTGFAMAPGPVTFAIFAGVGETLQQKARVPTRVITSVGYVIAAIGTVLFVVLTKDNAGYAGGFLPAWLVVGVGVGLAMPLTISSATAELPPAQAATGSAIVTMATQIGSVIGISLLVALLGAASATAALSDFHHAWWVGVGLALAAALTSLGISKPLAVTS